MLSNEVELSGLGYIWAETQKILNAKCDAEE
jgi:hypothetical protein